MSSPHPLPPKKEVALALLERSSVHVHLDPRAQGVAVPTWFRKQPQLVLQIGLNMPVPIPDLRLDDEGMTCTLSFSRQPFYCIVPWSSVFAMVGDDGRGMVWPDDVPPEISSQPKQNEQGERTEGGAPPPALAVAPAPSAAGSSKRQAKRVAPVEVAVASSDEKPAKARKSRAKKPKSAPESESEKGAASTKEAEPELRPMLVAVPNIDKSAEKSVDKRLEKRGEGGQPQGRPQPAPQARPEAARAQRFDKTSEKDPPRLERPSPSHGAGAHGAGTRGAGAQGSHGGRPMGGQPKVKRELPPYLRVVK